MILEKLQIYLKNVFGYDGDIHALDDARAIGLPIYLSQIYSLFQIKLFDRRLVLAVEQLEEQTFTPTEYGRHLELLQRATKTPVALVISHLHAYDRNRLVKQGTQFIVPGTQMFLPQLRVDLREYFPQRHIASSDTLSAAAQTIFLFHLECRKMVHIPLRQIAEMTGYSAMTVTKAVRELADCELCNLIGAGRALHLSFPQQGKDLWHAALPYLRNPVLERHSVVGSLPVPIRSAGLTALSEMSDLSDDRLKTYAIARHDLTRLKRQGEVVLGRSRDEATAYLEAWSYDPGVLSDSDRVDALSLYLSLNTSPDERIQAALEQTMEKMQWLKE